MSIKNTQYIYHLYRQDGSSLFLHPFSSPAKLLAVLEKYELEGKYGHEPRVESLTLFRNELYRMIEDGVKEWVSEMRFIPKFLISSGVFLGAYLFLSFVIRDPLPMLDELLLSIAGAGAVYFLLGRKDMRSDLVLKKRVSLRSAVDRIVFTESTFIREVEAVLHETETQKLDQALDLITTPPEKQFGEGDMKDAKQLLQYLEKKFDTMELKRKEKLMIKLSRENQKNRAEDLLNKWLSSKKIDFPLFVLYSRVKRNLERVP